MNIILKRLSVFYEGQLKRTQFGFRSGVGCNDGIYMLKQLQEVAFMSNRQLYTCFIDLTAAFDHVNRDFLFQTLRNRLNPAHDATNLDIIENLYESTTSYMHTDKETDGFQTKSGVRQGGMEGPPLYNLFSDYALRVHEARRMDAGLTGLSIPYFIPNEATNRVQNSQAAQSGVCEDTEGGYADDLCMFSWSEEGLRTSINILADVFNEFGLNINQTKTETIIFNWEALNQSGYPDTILNINGKQIQNSTSFRYLGVYVTYNDLHIGKDEIENRINSAHRFCTKQETSNKYEYTFANSNSIFKCPGKISSNIWLLCLEAKNSRDQQTGCYVQVFSPLYALEWSSQNKSTTFNQSSIIIIIQ